ncbi:hypothetical protein [Streptomyces sp. NPDC051704]|uniref:hypothetical protein n=1 Tax=Streptomyces sp. NPDC051704 TaxID=3365671 RepID=UPI003790AA07
MGDAASLVAGSGEHESAVEFEVGGEARQAGGEFGERVVLGVGRCVCFAEAGEQQETEEVEPPPRQNRC